MSEQQTAAAPTCTTVLFVRHTEVENPGRVLYGRLPRFRLSVAGVRHAEQIAAFLARFPVRAIYSSPLLRARQTADIIARRHPAASRHRSALLHEVRSAWEGTAFSAFRPGFSTYHDRKHESDESIEQIKERMLAFVSRAGRRHPGETVVAVSHGDPITILRVALSGKPLDLPAIRGANYVTLGSLLRVTVSDDGHVVSCELLDASRD
jgi:probable phosphoglycerate mutase